MKYILKVVKPTKGNEIIAEFRTSDRHYYDYAEKIQSMMQSNYEDKIRVDIYEVDMYENARFFCGTL